jgi:hypothetical protein
MVPLIFAALGSCLTVKKMKLRWLDFHAKQNLPISELDEDFHNIKFLVIIFHLHEEIPFFLLCWGLGLPSTITTIRNILIFRCFILHDKMCNVNRERVQCTVHQISVKRIIINIFASS